MSIKSYKGFNKDLKCRGFQYEIGEEYEMGGCIEVCRRGFHACENPLDVFDYYPMIGSRFCEVEQYGDIDRDDAEAKVCSSKIKIKAELKLADMINLGVEWLKEATLSKEMIDDAKCDVSDDNAEIVSSDDDAQIRSSSYRSKIGSLGDKAKIGSSGSEVSIESSGCAAKIESSGYAAKIGSLGYNAQIGSSGLYAKIGSSGDNAQIGSSGHGAQIGSSGYGAKIGSSGNSAQISASGNHTQIESSGYGARIGSSGNEAKIDSIGENSVIMCAGANSIAKAGKGSWITLSEWSFSSEKGKYIPICVKTEFVDGDKIKADTYYKLKKGVFIEVEE